MFPSFPSSIVLATPRACYPMPANWSYPLTSDDLDDDLRGSAAMCDDMDTYMDDAGILEIIT